MGDTLIIEFEVRSKETQEPIPSMEQSRHELDCIAEENFLPGVMPQMMGMQVGEIKSFDFKFPDPWEPVQLAGLEATVCCILEY
jgi:FKBP-type peptidyl-prolyl cis-trans isomerase (trigger factor)